jgi:hypothetical protein
MAHFNDYNNEPITFDRVEYPIIPLPDPVLFEAGKFLTAGGTRVACKAFDAL